MDENTIAIEGGEPVAADTEFTEFLGVDADTFNERISGVENLLIAQLAGLAFIAGCILALMVVEVFKRV